jgi:hypothetical protein
MNISEVINDIKLGCGLNTIALPFDKPVEVVMQEILQTSIRTFSRFKPHIKEGYELIKNLKSPNDVAKKMNIYILPETLTTTHVHDAYAYPASSQYQSNEATTSAFTVGSPFVGFGAYYPQDIINAEMTGAAINKFAGITSRQPTSKWLGYNKIQLFDFPGSSFVQFVVKCDHDSNGESIPESCVESFMELATLDVQRVLYNNLKNMVNVGSAFKEIQIKIDDWSGAEQSRKELINSWTDSFHLDEMQELVQFF